MIRRVNKQILEKELVTDRTSTDSVCYLSEQ